LPGSTSQRALQLPMSQLPVHSTFGSSIHCASQLARSSAAHAAWKLTGVHCGARTLDLHLTAGVAFNVDVSAGADARLCGWGGCEETDERGDSGEEELVLHR